MPFREIQRDISDISPKMLSQELKALEENRIITRKLYDSMPVTVEYSLTSLGVSMKKLLVECAVNILEKKLSDTELRPAISRNVVHAEQRPINHRPPAVTGVRH